MVWIVYWILLAVMWEYIYITSGDLFYFIVALIATLVASVKWAHYWKEKEGPTMKGR